MAEPIQRAAAGGNEAEATVEATEKKEANTGDVAQPQAVAQQAQSEGIVYTQVETRNWRYAWA